MGDFKLTDHNKTAKTNFLLQWLEKPQKTVQSESSSTNVNKGKHIIQVFCSFLGYAMQTYQYLRFFSTRQNQ